MKALTNVNAHDFTHAVTMAGQARRDGGRVSFVGGGSDLLGMIKDDLAAPDRLVRLTRLSGLDTVASQGNGGVRIGGMITLTALSRHPVIRERYAVLAEAAGSVGTPQIRNAGTLAGNLTQRPWCWYFRQGFPCYKHGGTRCFSRTGENQFNAILGGGPSFIVHPSDTAPALVALDAQIHIVGDAGDRLVEPAGVVATAAFLAGKVDASLTTVAVVTGGNLTVETIQRLTEMAEGS